jgi:16S rRNA (guanine527-N7)-methyltransferase
VPSSSSDDFPEQNPAESLHAGAAGEPAGEPAEGPEEERVEEPAGEELPPSGSLAEAIARLGMAVPEDRIERLEEYCRRLWETNQSINLTRHTTWDLFARRDLLDTFHLASQIGDGEEILDVGSGGGVPGIPLAILRPDLQVSLCDSVSKKARAVDGIVLAMQLPIQVHAARVQDVLEEQTFDTLVTRAAGSIKQLCNWLEPYWHCFNRLLAIKGPRWIDERGEARHRGVLHGIRLRRIHGYKMPGTKSEAVILQMEKPRPGSS